MFLSHTSELRQYPERGASYIHLAERAVSAAGYAIVDMEDFEATDQAPDEFDDQKIRGSDVYVGIYGRRYGTPVRNRPDKSYTELEFDTATALGLPRLLFLLDSDSLDHRLPPKALEDRENGHRQDAFLARVQNSGDGITIKFFRNPDDLARLVERSLRVLAQQCRQAEDHRPDAPSATRRQVPELLPYLPDRHPQDQLLLRALEQPLNTDQTRPLVVIVHGEDDQLVSNYRDRFLEHTLKTQARSPIDAYESSLSWPEGSQWAAEGFADSFRQLITHALRRDGYGPAASGMVSTTDHLATLVLWSNTNTDDWCGNRDQILGRICAYWKDSGPLLNQRPIHWISINYRQPDPWPGSHRPWQCWLLPPYWFHRWRCSRLRRQNNRIRFALQALADTQAGAHLLVLPELESVRREDAEQWVRSRGVRTVLTGQEHNPVIQRLDQLEERVQRFYREWRTQSGQPRIPMRQLAEFLRHQLQQVMP